MSELPKTGIENTSTEGEPTEYLHYFGLISRQAAINGIAAYIEGAADMREPNDRNIATAWLLNDNEAIARHVPDTHRQEVVHAALMRASTELWANFHMQRYRDLRPDRLRSLDQAEISDL